jgi:hypothetical protein
MGVPVTKLIETNTTTSKQDLTVSFYLSDPNPPKPSDGNIKREYKSLQVYVKIFKGQSFYSKTVEKHVNDLANALSTKYGGTFYPPNVKYIKAGYDSPFVAPRNRTNEVWLIKKSVSHPLKISSGARLAIIKTL